ncbi:MAG: hypothetical protein IJD10_06920 [Clostridia bacterium]|nr:hypothetical protein [Clostridia bacterium]
MNHVIGNGLRLTAFGGALAKLLQGTDVFLLNSPRAVDFITDLCYTFADINNPKGTFP